MEVEPRDAAAAALPISPSNGRSGTPACRSADQAGRHDPHTRDASPSPARTKPGVPLEIGRSARPAPAPRRLCPLGVESVSAAAAARTGSTPSGRRWTSGCWTRRWSRSSSAADLDRDAGFVLVGDGWHPGVVGIVASRVVERYGRPTFLIAFDGEIGKGSGRSTSRFDLHSALLACGDLLERFGGHHMAAGLTIRRGNLDASASASPTSPAQRLGPDDLGPGAAGGSGGQLWRGSPTSWSGSAATWSPAGRATRARCSGCGACVSRGRQSVGNGHLKGVLDDGPVTAPGHRLPVGRPGALAGRRPGGRGVPDRVRRVERLQLTLQARLCALSLRRAQRRQGADAP